MSKLSEQITGLPYWPDPTPEMLEDPAFDAVWDRIKTWDICVPEIDGDFYSGATGNHVRAILDTLYDNGNPNESDEKNAVFPIDDCLLVNNKHGERRLAEGDIYKQSIATNSGVFPVGWSWDLATEQAGVKGYPQIQWGHNPHTGRVAGSRLPVKLKDIKHLAIGHNAAVQGKGNFSLVFDLWITSDPFPTKETITDEIMIWLVDKIKDTNHTHLTELDLGWRSWKVGKAEWHRYPSWLFIPDRQVTSAITNIGPMIQMLLDNNYVDPEHYLASVALGSEMHNGSGIVVLKNYKISMGVHE